MGKEKVTISLDRSKADDARSLVEAHSTSEVIDIALDHLIRIRHALGVPFHDDGLQSVVRGDHGTGVPGEVARLA